MSINPVDNNNTTPEVCIIELGGTIGDIEGMPFVEAFRQFQFRVKRDNICLIHVSLVPQPSSTGEQKTKPTQASVRELRGLGLSPDFIVCRSENPIDDVIKQKISNFCHVSTEQVICLHDVKSIYNVPLMLEKQHLSNLLSERLSLSISTVKPRTFMKKWKDLVEKEDCLRHSVSIALVGKYTELQDSYASVLKALQHAALACNRKLKVNFVEADHLEDLTKQSSPVKYHEAWQKVCKSDGILVPGGFGTRGMEGKIAVCKWARLQKRPLLGVCLGLQAAVIEFCRNVLGWKDANSQEMDPEGTRHVVIEMPEHNVGMLGGTMRLGKRRTIFRIRKSKVCKLYGNVEYVEERHRHRYEVNPEHVDQLAKAGMKFVGEDEEGNRMEIMELDDHPYYVACQYHPEYLTRPLKPSPPYLGLILASCGKLVPYLSRECPITPPDTPESSDEELPMPPHLLVRESDLPSISSRNSSALNESLANQEVDKTASSIEPSKNSES